MLRLLEIAGAAAFALLGALVVVLVLGRWTGLAARPHPGARTAVFLFRGQSLVEASPVARRFLRGRGRGGAELGALLGLLSRDFGPDLAQRIAALAPGDRFLQPGAGGTLEVEEEEGSLRLVLRLEEEAEARLDRLSLVAAREELTLLRGIAEDAPQPIWTLDAAGGLSWANAAYLELADRIGGPPSAAGGPGAGLRAAWPAEPLFAPPADLPEGAVRQERLPLRAPGRDEPLWFDVTSVRRGAGTLNFATDVGGLVLAESARLHVVQALAKTFAHLSTGLAIFDRQRRLVLFNPAFVDLTGLPVDFLSGRPLVHSVLDRLRDAKILPEPRDYASWREEIAALEAAASEGAYSDIWTLATGQTYRVTGRPQPDGAIAFLFEDISAEVGLTRRHRAELEGIRAVLDAMEEAVAAFGADGGLTFANAGYRALWGEPPGPAGPEDLARERARWEAACAPSPAWAALSLAPPARGPGQEEELRHRDGRHIRLRTVALPRGATLVSFHVGPASTNPRDSLGPPPGAFATAAE